MSSRNDLPSAPLYGGPPVPREPKRRWLLLVVLGVVVIAGLVAWRLV